MDVILRPQPLRGPVAALEALILQGYQDMSREALKALLGRLMALCATGGGQRGRSVPVRV